MNFEKKLTVLFILLATGLLVLLCEFYKLRSKTQKDCFVVPEKRPFFVLLTDFGYDFAVGSIKGVILKNLPHATVIDLDHSIKKFNIISGGFVLAKSYRYFPEGTIFVCVIDPGVGTEREPLCIVTPHYAFVGPNNGIFDSILMLECSSTVYEIDPAYLQGKSNTFHGRDLFAPAAVDIFNNKLEHFKLFDLSKICHVTLPDNQIIITYIDSFGNIKTNKTQESLFLSKKISLTIADKTYHIPVVKTFNDVRSGDLLCYMGSNNTLEFAVNGGSAAEILDVTVGDTMVIF